MDYAVKKRENSVNINTYIYTAVQFALCLLLHNHREITERKRIMTSHYVSAW